MTLQSSTKRIRLAASPLVVAVALGFLGPAALEEEDLNPSSDCRNPDNQELSEMMSAMTQDIRADLGLKS